MPNWIAGIESLSYAFKSLLEEISANLGYDVLIDPIELIEMKNLLKVRINNKAFSLDTYEVINL